MNEWVSEWVSEWMREWLTEWICASSLGTLPGGFGWGVAQEPRGWAHRKQTTWLSTEIWTQNYANAWELCIFHCLHYNKNIRYMLYAITNDPTHWLNIFLRHCFFLFGFFFIPATRFCWLILSPNYLARFFAHSLSVFCRFIARFKRQKIIIKSQKNH